MRLTERSAVASILGSRAEDRDRQTRHSKIGSMMFLGALAVGALILTGLSIAIADSKSIGRLDTLMLRSTSSFSLRVLSVDLGRKGAVGLRTCAAPDAFGCCKEAWRTTQRRLSSKELQTLGRLAREAELFSGKID